jgi:ribosomal protein S18 acetylase RimI-like enzyme
MLRTRPATASDAPFLRELHHSAYRDLVECQFGSWDERQQDAFFEQSLRDADFEVILDGDSAVGAIGTRLHSDHLFLAEIQVRPEHQNRGIGTAMLRAQIARAVDLKKPLGLQVLRENRAKDWYERHGFAVISETETHYMMLRPHPGHVID